jgi:hypothetical protein
MRLSTRLIIALTVIILTVILIGICGTFATFTAVFRTIELVFSVWGSLFILLLIGICSAALFVGFFLGLWLAIVEIQIRRQKYIRFAPSPEGYYEAILAPGGFFRPADNVPLLPPHTYSPHITMSQAKSGEMQGDDATILELYEKGLSMSAISKALGTPYSQVQKILRPKREG